jgi:excisionase family DNA binding protein
MSLITTGKAARLAGVSRETIQNYIQDKKLPVESRTPGGHYRLDEAKVRAILCKPITLEDALA